MSGDLDYYSKIDKDDLKEKCKGNYIEVNGIVDYVYENLGTIHIGNYLSGDKVEFNCDLLNSDAAEDIKDGDLVTVRGECSSVIGSYIYLKDCTVEKHTKQADLESLPPSVEDDTEQNKEPSHTHSFSAATCTEPKTCICGETEGKANGHNWVKATCESPKTCSTCGETSGSKADHNFKNGKCVVCGKAEPNNNSEDMVWIPTNGGKKYHSHSGCSGMKSPKQVTEKQAKSRGFTACKKCF